jgi:hypothetical protein
MKNEPQKEIRRRQRAAEAWAWEFNQPAREFNGVNAALDTPSKKALGVYVLTGHIRDYLAEHDPMALRQAQETLNGKSYIDFLV